MARSLHDAEPVAGQLFDQANEILGFDLKTACFEGPNETLTQTSVCQPALFVHGMAVAEVLRERGLLTDATVALGLSLGELTALTAAGAFDFATGLRVVAERGRLMQHACEASEGSMASLIGGSRERAEALARAVDIDVANFNCPGQIVVSGARGGIAEAVARAKEFGFKMARELNVAGAYHSRLMEPAREGFEHFLGTVTVTPPTMTVFSNATGQAVREPEEIKTALVRQVVSPVLWEDCFQGAIAAGATRFYECGPGAVLAGLGRRIDATVKVVSVAEKDDLPEA
jgi:[acyl-carrier-protein] S-malonyltransferase